MTLDAHQIALIDLGGIALSSPKPIRCSHFFNGPKNTPKREYRCFLLSSLAGTPQVPAPGDVCGPCD